MGGTGPGAGMDRVMGQQVSGAADSSGQNGAGETASADGEQSLGRLVLDVDEWRVLKELLPQVRQPAGFAAQWGLLADADASAQARSLARARLAGRGLLVGDAVSGPLADALTRFGEDPIQVRVRSWSGDRAVIAVLAVGGDAGVGLTRLQQVEVDEANRPRVVRDGLGVEISVFAPAEVVDVIWRMLPPAVTGAVVSSDAPGRGVSLEGEDLLALVEALQPAGGSTADGAFGAQVLRLLLAQAGFAEVPAAVADLATRLSGAVEITVAGPGQSWFGFWLLGGDRLVTLTPGTRSVSRGEPVVDLFAAPGTPPAAPVVEDIVTVTLDEVDGRSVRRDLTRAVVAALQGVHGGR